MKQHTITGLGPIRPDGSQFIFVANRPSPLVVSDDWRAAQGKSAAVGDVMEENDKGLFRLISMPQPAAEEEAQKKSAGSADSTSGAEHSPFKSYAAKPIVVHAAEITGVGEVDVGGDITLTFADGSTKIATPQMTSRMMPSLGDYWVIVPQGDGVYEYLNPKDVFEGKYEPVKAEE